MSAIYFHSPSGEVAVRGAERAMFGQLVSQIGLAVLNPEWHRDALTAALPEGHYLRESLMNDPDWARSFRLAASVGDLSLTFAGETVDAFTLNLNTTSRVGNDALRLVARLHAQCELHAWVDGTNRGWLAGLIDDGRAAGILREGMGWESVSELLWSRDDEPVVTSFSVCDQFPNFYVSDLYPAWPEGIPEKWDALSEEEQKRRSKQADDWYDLDAEAQWASAMRGLRAAPGQLEMRPDEWSDFTFGNGWDAFSIERRMQLA